MHNMYLNDVGTGDYGYKAIENIKKNNYIFKAVVPTMNTMKDINTPPLKLENPSLKNLLV
ncbi:Uncharacterised protein [Brachyspira pilosicoli]|uniref:hypothetical protein n=1 Tax=Brachyspira pilosicoli TaxID=52584 RepID=UPI000E13792E|nr:hypothetical protein [Brachyspira pilosicoli]SUW21347.1 Uncharacterised protein [Brachyspira pilosicoli]